MPETERQLRQELTDAIEKVRRELEILGSPSTIGGRPDNHAVIADLRTELRALEEARANL